MPSPSASFPQQRNGLCPPLHLSSFPLGSRKNLMGTLRRLGLGTWLVPGVSFTIAIQKKAHSQ